MSSVEESPFHTIPSNVDLAFSFASSTYCIYPCIYAHHLLPFILLSLSVVLTYNTMLCFPLPYPPSHTTDPPIPAPTPPSSSSLLQILSLNPPSLPPSLPTHPSQHATTTAATKDWISWSVFVLPTPHISAKGRERRESSSWR
jgi:hypothetical protein